VKAQSQQDLPSSRQPVSSTFTEELWRKAD
jgi:hypothetical protein